MARIVADVRLISMYDTLMACTFRRWVMSILQYTLATNMLRLPAVAGAQDREYAQLHTDDHVSAPANIRRLRYAYFLYVDKSIPSV